MIKPPKPKVPTLKQIAARIQEHLRRWIGPSAICWVDGRKVAIFYSSQLTARAFLTKTEALQYLAYLDGGGTGTHLLGKKESDDA